MQNFYVDTCIYLNLWKKEVDERGNLLWLFAKNFFELAKHNNAKIFYSGFILKELLSLLSTEDYLEKKSFLEENKMFEKILLTEEEYRKAINLKNKINTDCSLIDIIHIIIAHKTESVLVTQDKELLDLANNYEVTAKKPQEIINY
jgi:predicted nucleic acid-binding protein